MAVHTGVMPDGTTVEPRQDTGARRIRWGILATGNIAQSFAADLKLLPAAELAAVGSRSSASAERFAAALGGIRAYGSYAELAEDPDLDVIYVATPHGRHVEDVMTCFQAGKAVLCEKALTLDAASARRLVDEARRRRLFFAEAMWTRTLPAVRRAVHLARSGHCGSVRSVRADLGFVAPADPASRLWDPDLGASALLDVGIYPLTFAYLVLGRPNVVTSTAVLDERGVDVNGGALLTYDCGAVASVSWTQTAWSDSRASIAGDEGRIELPSRFHQARTLTCTANQDSDTFHETAHGNGYTYEALEVMRCLREGLTESPLLPLDETVEILQLTDLVRAQWATRERDD